MIPMAIMMIEDENDQAFIQRLFLQNERSMYAMAVNLVKEHKTACDMVSASCVKMIEKIDYLREIDEQKLTPYILSIVKNTALMYLRQRRNESLWMVSDERTFDWLSSSADHVDDALLAEAESQALRSAISRLKQRDRDLLIMKYFSQMDDAEIGRQLGINKNSVRYYLTVARRALKEEMKREDDPYA